MKQKSDEDRTEMNLVLPNHQLAPNSQTTHSHSTFLNPKQISAAFATITDLLQVTEIFQITCRVAVELFQVNHSGLIIFDHMAESSQVVAEFPDQGLVGHHILASENDANMGLQAHAGPLFIPNVRQAGAWLGATQKMLLQLKIDSLLLVPLIVDEQIYGAFTLNLIGDQRIFTQAEIMLCQMFAAQVSQAIQRATQRQTVDSHADAHEQTPAPFPLPNQTQLAQTIVSQAVTMLNAKGGGLYRFYPETKSLELIADTRPDASLKGTKLAVGEGAAGHLIASDEPYLIIHDYEQWSNPAPIYRGKRFFGAVIEVPLRYDGQIIGVLFVDDSVGRTFTEQDAHLLQFFADQAAAAWYHAHIAAVDARRVHRLEALTRASADIMSHLGKLPLPGLLTRIARHAAEVLDAEACSILQVKRPGFLTFVAAHGYSLDKLPLGREFPIETGSGTGLTGHIAYEARLFNAHGEALRHHPAVSGTETPLAASGACYAILAIPLQQVVNGRQRLVGLLRVENKKDSHGHINEDLPFDQQDEWLLHLLADTILIALDNAALMIELDTQKNQLRRLLRAAPTAVVANDENGRIFFVNPQAEQIIGRSESELLHKPVFEIYADENDPREIGHQLDINDDHLTEYNVLLRHKDGTPRPVRLTATRIFDTQGKMSGTVGYFEDMSTIHETRRRLEWLLTASNELTQADTLASGLQRLADRIAQLQPVHFCSLWTATADNNVLELQAATHRALQKEPIQGWPQINLSKCPHIAHLMANENGADFLFQLNHPGCVELKTALASMVKLDENEQPGLLLPLRLSDRVVGIIFMTLVPNWNADPYANDFMHLIISIADQTALLIERLLTLEATQRREQLLAALNEATQVIRAELSPAQLWREVVRLAIELTGCTAGGLFLNSTLLNELTLVAVYNLPDDLLGSSIKYGDGIVGKAAAQEQLIYTNQYQAWQLPNSLLAQFPFETVVAIPLKTKTSGAVSAVLMIADTERWHHVTKTELNILDLFAAQAAVTLHTTNLIRGEQRAVDHLSLLQRISNYVQTTDNLTNVLHVFLTGITAGYGLGFNCAAFMLVEPSQKWLVGEAGIGHIDKKDAETAWNESQAAGLDQFDAYQDNVEKGEISLTPIGERIYHIKLPLEQNHNNPFTHVIHNRTCYILDPAEFYRLPPRFSAAYQPTTAIVIAPLIVRDRTIGILIADNRFTHIPITKSSLELVMTFAGAAAIAIDKTRLLLETRLAQERFQAFYAASQSLVSAAEPVTVLQQIAEKAQAVVQAVWVSLILIDVPGRLQRMVHSHQTGFVPPNLSIREQGLSMTIMQTGQEIVIDSLSDTSWSVHPETIQRAIRAVAGFPLSIRGRRIGVMWIHYDVPHHFTFAELEALKLFVNQAALAYDNALRLRGLDRMRRASQELAGATNLKMVLNKITRNAIQTLDADSAAVWSFDEERGTFLLQAWDGDASDNFIWDQFHHEPPSTGGMAYLVMQKGWLGINSVSDKATNTFLSAKTRDRLENIGVASFQAVALQVGQEKLGVLYINYRLPHVFSASEEKAARTFAVYSALALKKVKLLDEFRRARDAAQAVARMTALESLEATLMEVLKGTKAALNCDVITLYVYDAQTERISAYPFTLGVWNESGVTQLSEIPENSIIYKILRQRKMYIAEDALVDPLIRHSRFSAEEKIATCVALSLRINHEPVGALFVNYRTHHRFTSDELDNIRLFGNQAAVAINNAQLYQREQSRSRALAALYKASQAVAVSLNLEEILTRILEQAWHLIRYQEQKASYGSIWLVEDELNARLVATVPIEAFMETKSKVGTVINWQTGHAGRVGVIGRVIQTRQAIFVSDVRGHADYLETRSSTLSELAVPIRGRHGILGVINLEHETIDAFKAENIEAVESLATQAAIAIHNSKLFDQAVKHARLLDAAAQVASHAITILDEDQLLNETVDLITTQLEFYHAAVFLLEQNQTVARLRAASSQGGKKMMAQGYFIAVSDDSIVGTVAVRGTPYLTDDITQDSHHLANPLLPLTHAEMAFPLIARGKVIGVLDVQSQQMVALETEEVSALQTMANQLANAIQNARYYTEVNRRAAALQALQEAGQAISGSLELNEVLNNIVEQAWHLTGTHGPTAQFSCLTLVNEASTKLSFEAAYPRETLTALWHTVGDIDITKPVRHGIMGRAVHERRSQLVRDVTQDKNYVPFDKNIRAELAVPIILKNKVIGVINVEHPTVDAFDEDDLQSLTTLAAHAAVVIDKADSYKELQDTHQALQRTHRMMEARTAVAYMGMASSIWGHDITNYAQVIKEQIELLESDLTEFGISAKQYSYRLDMISGLAEKIRQKPLTLPLRAEETMTAVVVNDLVGERARQLWQNSPYREATLKLALTLPKTEMIWASAEWLRRVLDILLDNAVEAMQHTSKKRITIRTQFNHDLVEIAVVDTGSGLPPEIREKIGIEHIQRAEDAKGLGMGLLMAQIIVQAYDGQLQVGHTGPAGTCIRILLPRYAQEKR